MFGDKPSEDGSKIEKESFDTDDKMEVRASLSRIVEEREMADVEKGFEGVEENLRNHQKMTKKELEQKNEELAYEREAALAKAVLFITRQQRNQRNQEKKNEMLILVLSRHDAVLQERASRKLKDGL